MSFFKKKEEAVADGNVLDEKNLESIEIKRRTSEYTKFTPPSSLKQVFYVMMLEFKQYFKSKAIIVLFVFAALIPVLEMTGALHIVDFMASFFSFTTGHTTLTSLSYLHLCIIMLPLVMLFAMMSLCGRTISQEYTGKTCYLNFPLPVDRWVLFTGKFVAILITCITLILFTYGLGMVATTIKYGSIVLDPIYISVALSIVTMAALISLGMFFSSISKRRGGGLAFVVVYFIVPAIAFAVMLSSSDLKAAASSIEFMLYTPSFAVEEVLIALSWDPTLSLAGAVIGTSFTNIASAGMIALAMIIWAAVFYAIGVFMFTRREA